MSLCAAIGIWILLDIVLLEGWYGKDECRYTAVRIFSGLAMNLTDATLVLLLAARIHGTDEAVRASAKSVVKKLPRSKRDLIYKVIDSRRPLELVGFLAQNLDAE
ncbi:hypothetical protein SAMN04490193_1382 [Pseudomonas marginalis]|nr:hypothetical protein SAMN04490193_1382 [Pseudomonas marginalis]